MSNTETLTHRDVTEVTATTVRIPHDLLIEAKGVCVTEKTSVNEMLLSGLRRELDARKEARSAGDKSAPGGPGAPQSNKPIGGEGEEG